MLLKQKKNSMYWNSFFEVWEMVELFNQDFINLFLSCSDGF
jgi:hypothetical protein